MGIDGWDDRAVVRQVSKRPIRQDLALASMERRIEQAETQLNEIRWEGEAIIAAAQAEAEKLRQAALDEVRTAQGQALEIRDAAEFMRTKTLKDCEEVVRGYFEKLEGEWSKVRRALIGSRDQMLKKLEEELK